ncbi:putative LipO-oligosaccharide acyltransferase [Neisseria meningitidis]|nr:putative LipO-oligosaccharide acyltransferase [Neisseria meningitidis]
MKPMKLRLHLNFENRHNLLCNPFEHSGIKAGGFYILKYSGLTKIRTKGGGRQTVQIVRQGKGTPYRFLLIHYKNAC